MKRMILKILFWTALIFLAWIIANEQNKLWRNTYKLIKEN